MSWKIEYRYKDVEQFVMKLPPGLFAKYFHLTDLMLEFGADLGMPHTKAMSDGLFELRVKSKEGIARVFYYNGGPAYHYVACFHQEDSENPGQRNA